MTLQQQENKYGIPPIDARCPAGCSLGIFVQAWGDSGAWCEAGMSGAHIVERYTLGCKTHTYFHSAGHEFSRHCPDDCKWSRESPSVNKDGDA